MKNFGLLDPEYKVILLFDTSVVTHPTARRHSPHDVKLQHWPVWTLVVGTANVPRMRRESVSIPHIGSEFSTEARLYAGAYWPRSGWVPGLMRPGCASTSHFRIQCQD